MLNVFNELGSLRIPRVCFHFKVLTKDNDTFLGYSGFTKPSVLYVNIIV